MIRKWKCGLALFISLALFGITDVVQAHEPIFGIGPHTIYKDGFGLELEYEREQGEDGYEQTLHYEVGYGLTADWVALLTVPQVQKSEEDRAASGLGDMTIKTKWRFYRKDYREGRQDQVALLAGVKLPTGDHEAEIPLGSGSTDYIVGLTAGKESRTLYYFADLRYRLNGENDKKLKMGDVWFYGVSFGFRPWQNEYWEPDLVLLLELFGKQMAGARLDGQELENSGGHTVFIGPSFLLSYKNWMVTGGIAVPALQDFNGEQEKELYQFALGIEQHL